MFVHFRATENQAERPNYILDTKYIHSYSPSFHENSQKNVFCVFKVKFKRNGAIAEPN